MSLISQVTQRQNNDTVTLGNLDFEPPFISMEGRIKKKSKAVKTYIISVSSSFSEKCCENNLCVEEATY